MLYRYRPDVGAHSKLSNKDKVNDSELLEKINVGYMSTHSSNDGASWQCAGKTKRYANMSISK